MSRPPPFPPLAARATPAGPGRPGRRARTRPRQPWWLMPAAIAVLAACTTAPPLSLRYYQLRDDPPAGAPAAPSSPLAAEGVVTGHVWQVGLVTLPGYLDRDEMVIPVGRAGLQPQPTYRWAEPLRDTVPRLLRLDLARLLGPERVWDAALPSGVRPDRLLRVELSRFEADTAGEAVLLHARWFSIDPRDGRLIRLREESLRAASAGPDADSLAAAHRQALWQLAERIAAEERLPGAVMRPAPIAPGQPAAR